MKRVFMILIVVLVCLCGALSYQLYTCHKNMIYMQIELFSLKTRDIEMQAKESLDFPEPCPVCSNKQLMHYVDSLYETVDTIFEN